MSMTATTSQLDTLEAQRRHYAAVRERLGLKRVYTPTVVMRPALPPPPPPEPVALLPPQEVRRVREKKMRREREEKLVAMLSSLAKRPNDATNFNRILIEVADRNKLPYDFVYSRSRLDCIAHARAEFYYLLRVNTRLSLTAIGRRVGRDHTTILHGIKQHCERTGLAYPAG